LWAVRPERVRVSMKRFSGLNYVYVVRLIAQGRLETESLAMRTGTLERKGLPRLWSVGNTTRMMVPGYKVGQ